METKRITVAVARSLAGLEIWPTDEPYASQYTNVAGLQAATDNATYRGVRFGRAIQRRIGFVRLLGFDDPQWQAIREHGGGEIEVELDTLAELAAKSAEIDRIIAGAVPAPTTYACAGHADGCANRVVTRGAYCPTCAFDNA